MTERMSLLNTAVDSVDNRRCVYEEIIVSVDSNLYF